MEFAIVAAETVNFVLILDCRFKFYYSLNTHVCWKHNIKFLENLMETTDTPFIEATMK